MACTKAPTGPCTKTPSGDCAPRRTLWSLPVLENVVVVGQADEFILTWNGLPASPAYEVLMLYRAEDGGPMFPRLSAAADAAVLWSDDGLIAFSWYNIWYRVQDEQYYGPWVRTQAFIDADWTSESSAVFHLGDRVYHGADLVVIG